MRSTLGSLVAGTVIAMAPGCRESVESSRCLEIEGNIRVIADFVRVQPLLLPGSTRLDDLCSRAIGQEHDAEIERDKYMDECSVTTRKEEIIKNRMLGIRKARIKACSHAYEASPQDGI